MSPPAVAAGFFLFSLGHFTSSSFFAGRDSSLNSEEREPELSHIEALGTSRVSW